MVRLIDAMLRMTEREEVLRLKAATLKRQEVALVEEASRLEREKLLHIRELKRIRDEVMG